MISIWPTLFCSKQPTMLIRSSTLVFGLILLAGWAATVPVEDGHHLTYYLLDDETTTVKHKLSMSTNDLKTIVDDITDIQLKLDPKLPNSSLEVHLLCLDYPSGEFNFSSTDPKCSILEVTSGYAYNFDASQPEVNNVTIKSIKAGKQFLVASIKNPDDPDFNIKNAYVSVNVGRSKVIPNISFIIGLIYFVAWSISFYPQIWINFKRKSVVGLNFDFVALNITGFISYSIFNVALFYIPYVQDQFEEKNPRSQIPVEFNDVVFAVHAVFATLICIIQCFFYERQDQTLSLFSKIFLSVVWLGYAILAIVAWVAPNLLSALLFLNIMSYVKLTITIIKYIPQAWFNYQRKSTVGWSIGNIFLDSTGGLLSMIQMFLLAYNYDDWATIFANFTKFGLGFISILFDVVFILQHYVFYRNSSHGSQSSLLDDAIIQQAPASRRLSEKSPIETLSARKYT